MKKIYPVLLIPVIFLFIINNGFSQDYNRTPSSTEDRARKITDRLNEKLSFYDGQDSLVFQAYQDFFSSMDMLKNFKDNNDETRKAADNARNELDGKMKNILSSGQYEKYSSIVKDMQKNGQKKRGNQDMKRNIKNE